MDDRAADLPRRLVAELGQPYGHERSFKLAPGEFRGDRYVVSVHIGAFGHDPLARLVDCARRLRMPEELIARLPDALRGCDIVHFGHEGTAEGPLAKIYLEYAEAAHAAMGRPDGGGTLVHRVFKWRPADGRHQISLYRWPGDRDFGQVGEAVSALLPDVAAQAPVLRALHIARERGRDVPPSLDVRDEESARHSFDVMLYGAELRLTDIEPDLRDLATTWHLLPELERQLGAGTTQEVLGHLSGGLSEQGLPFLSVYFGVQAHQGGSW